MDPNFRTPRLLVEALQAGRAPARRALHRLLLAPVQRLMDEIIARHHLEADRDLLVLHVLHLAETTLRLRPLETYSSLSWEAFRASLLLFLARMVGEPFSGKRPDGSSPGPSPLPDAPEYHSETFFLPHGRSGQHSFGGDWYLGERAHDGSLWVLLADVTGHGYYAYLVATALPAIWQRCWSHRSEGPHHPATLLAAMHDLLADCLPDGIFLECTLVRFDPDGHTTVLPAGGSKLLVHPAGHQPDLVKLRGAWIGLRAPQPEEQHYLQLKPGDELVLATDGVFDQLAETGGAEAIAEAIAKGVAHGVTPRQGALFEALREALDRSVATGHQMDDITMVLIRRREPPAGSAGSPGTSHVPV